MLNPNFNSHIFKNQNWIIPFPDLSKQLERFVMNKVEPKRKKEKNTEIITNIDHSNAGILETLYQLRFRRICNGGFSNQSKGRVS